MDRRKALASLAGLTGAVAVPAAAEGAAPVIPGAYRFTATSREIPVSVSSHPVRWRDQDYRLVHIAEAQFSISATGRLTGIVSAGVNTFDNVDYDVHCAVFDAQGRLLGTASTVCSVPRIWVGTLGVSPVKLQLDFGVSEAYKRGEWFTLGITERKVLTPDQWAAEGN